MTDPGAVPARLRAPAILILAAGLARRMGGADKLTEKIAGTPLIRRTAQAALATGKMVYVTLPPPPHDRWDALKGLDVQRVILDDPGLGMGASIAAGMAALGPTAEAVLIHLADMPDIGTAELQTILTARSPADPAQIVRAGSQGGQPGHPILFGPDHFAALERLNGDRGAQALVQNANAVMIIPLPGEAALTDLDTPQAWEDWRAANPEV